MDGKHAAAARQATTGASFGWAFRGLSAALTSTRHFLRATIRKRARSRRGDVDLAAAEHGGLVVACSDMFFGSRHNLIMPGDARNMGDGWETKRRRGPGHDWTIVRLATAGVLRRIEVDTRHFKGNAPGSCSLDACAAGNDALV